VEVLRAEITQLKEETRSYSGAGGGRQTAEADSVASLNLRIPMVK